MTGTDSRLGRNSIRTLQGMSWQDRVQDAKLGPASRMCVRAWSIQACLKAPFGSTTYSVGRRSVSAAKPGPFADAAYALARSATWTDISSP